MPIKGRIEHIAPLTKNKSKGVVEINSTSVQQESNTAWSKDSLFHGKSLLITSSHDFEDIALEFLSLKNKNNKMSVITLRKKENNKLTNV